MMKKVMFLVMMLSVSIFAAHDITLGETVEGEWTEDSPKGGETNRAKEYYTFTLTDETNVVISIKSELDERLRLYDSENNMIKKGLYDGGDGDYSGARYKYYARLVAVLEAGTYTIDVTTWSGEELGDFTLSLKENNAIVTHSIGLNSIVEGSWTEESGLSIETARPKEYYTFTLHEQTKVVITQNSKLYDRLRLYDNQNNLLEEGNTIVALLEVGTYTIDVTTKHDDYYNTQFSDFTLSLGQYTNKIETFPISLNSTTRGALTGLSGRSIAENRAKEYYTFTLSEKTNISINLESQFWEKLRLYDNQKNLIGTGVEYLTGTKYNVNNFFNLSGYSERRIAVILEAGTYTIDVSSRSNPGLGDFTLSLKENIIANHPIMLNSTVEGAWTNESGKSLGDAINTEQYTFTLTQKTTLLIKLKSLNTFGYGKTSIRLYDNQMMLLKATGYSGDRLVVDLDAGTYTIDISDASRNIDHWIYDKGEFILSLDVINPPISTQVNVNNVIDGKWSRDSQVSSYNQDYFAEYYTFTIMKKSRVIIGLTTRYNAHIEVVDENGKVLGFYSKGYNENNPPISMVLDVGTYRIEVGNSYHAGSFRLDIQSSDYYSFLVPIYGLILQ